MVKPDPAFVHWMQTDFPELWESKDKCLFTQGALFLAKEAWQAGRLHQQDSTYQLNLFEEVE